MATDQPLFPHLGRRKAYTMIQRDLAECGIQYITEEGCADFHAAGRHTHITGLLKSGVSLVEAEELARHSDVRMTMRYTHIRLADQATAVNRLPSLPPPPDGRAGEKCLHIVRHSGGEGVQTAASAGGPGQRTKSGRKRKKTLRKQGFFSCLSRLCQFLAVPAKKWRRRESNPPPNSTNCGKERNS